MIVDTGFECLKCGNKYMKKQDNEDIAHAITFSEAQCPDCGHIGAKYWDKKS